MPPDALIDSAAPEVDLGLEDRCDGARPALADCVHGGAWAECGGTTGGPIFACAGRCFWFEHGCVAEGFTATVCPADDLCCIDGYPYRSEWSDYGHVNT